MALAQILLTLKLTILNLKTQYHSVGLFVAKKSVEIGQLAAAGVPLVGFVDAGERWVTANYKETDLSHIKAGAKAWIEVDAIKGRTFKGVIESVSAATGATFTLLPPDNATGNFVKVTQRIPVRIRLDNPVSGTGLAPGMSALVEVEVN